jgi:hypothetical protein
LVSRYSGNWYRCPLVNKMPIINGKQVDLLIEQCEDYNFLQEDFKGQKHWMIEGVFLQQEVENRNRRKYPGSIMENEVNRYVSGMVTKNRAAGELGHPDGPTINPERVSHKITSLVKDGNNYIGKARISNSPFGKIVQNFLDEEIQFGVSSRGIGSLRRVDGVDMVQHDFHLATAADIVMDPSAPDAFVNGILENKEYILADGIIQEAKVDQWKKSIKSATMISLREVELAAYRDFLCELDNKFKF